MAVIVVVVAVAGKSQFIMYAVCVCAKEAGNMSAYSKKNMSTSGSTTAVLICHIGAALQLFHISINRDFNYSTYVMPLHTLYGCDMHMKGCITFIICHNFTGKTFWLRVFYSFRLYLSIYIEK